MDFDAIELFIKLLKKESLSNNDILMMSSYIKHKSIDINLSIKECANIISKDEEYVEILDEINEIINSSDEMLDIPIYYLLLEREIFHQLLIVAAKNGLLSDDHLIDLIESIIETFDYSKRIDLSENYILLNGILTSKKLTKIRDSYIISKFIADHDYVFDMELSSQDDKESNDFYTRIIAVKLFNFNYVSTNYHQVVDKDDNRNFIDSVILPLFEQKKYSYIRMLVNPSIMSDDEIEYLDLLIDKKFLPKYNETGDKSIYIMVEDIHRKILEKKIN